MTIQTTDPTSPSNTPETSNSDPLAGRPHLAHLSICGTCHTLFGEGPEPWQRQLCDCASEWERCVLAEEAFDATGVAWNRIAEVCRGCGAEVVDASDPFALWFCSTCVYWTQSINRGHGHAAIPLGRHTEVSRLPDEPGEDASQDERTAAAKLQYFVGQSFGINRRGRKVVEAHLDRAGVPSGQNVLLGEYLRAVRSDWVDQEYLFTQLVLDLDLQRFWRCYGHTALELDWVTEVGPVETYVATVESPWRYPDGRDGTTSLALRVVATNSGAWLWELSVGPDAANESDRILHTGVGPCVGDAAHECGWASLHIIGREYERRTGHASALAPLTPVVTAADDYASDPDPTIEEARTPRPLGGSPCW